MGLNRRNGTLTIALITALMGCGDPESAQRSTHNLSGRVEGSSQGSVDAHEISEDGESVPESDSQGTGSVGASGSYSVDVEVKTGVLANVLVETTTGATRRACIVASDFSGSATVVAEPMTVETTFESDVYIHALEDGLLCDGCTSTMVLDFVGESSAEAHADVSVEASLDAAASVTADAAEAFHAVLASSATSNASLRTALRAHTEARLTRAASLNAATSQTQVEAAEGDYIDAVVGAYADAGIDLDEQAAAANAAAESARARLDSLIVLEASMRASLLSDIETRRALVVTFAVESHATASGVSANTLETAGNTLRASLESAASAGASAEAQIDAAWDAYRVSVRATLRASLSAAEQSAFDTIVPAIESAAATARASLASSYSLSVNVSTWITPILGFSTSVNAQVDALVSAGVSESRASSMVRVLVAAELAGG